MTSVHALMRFCSARSAPGVFSVIMEVTARSLSDELALFCLRAVEMIPVPSGLVRMRESPILACALAVNLSGWTRPVTERP